MKTREPLRSRAFRLALLILAAAAILGVVLASQASRHAGAAVQLALARSQASHDLELQLERLNAAASAADVAAEVFLETWRPHRLDRAAAAEAAVRTRFDSLRTTLSTDADTAALAQQIDDALTERHDNSSRLTDWTRAGQFNRVREWAEQHRDVLRAGNLAQLIGRLQESERATRDRDRAALDAALHSNTRAARWSLAAQIALGGIVLWLLWQYERTRRLVVMCAWTRTIQYEGEWLTFEEYLRRRFGLETTHGIRPDQATAILEDDRPPEA